MNKLLFLQIALFASAVGLRAQHGFTPIDVEDGGRLYRANCSICHGAQGDGIGGLDPAPGTFLRAKNEAAVPAVIRTGIAGTAMPPNTFSDFQSLTIVAYLHSIAAATATSTSGGNPVNGKAIYDGK